MGQPNLELMDRSYQALNAHDLEALLELMDDDVEADSRLAAVEGGYHGHDGMRRWWDNLFGVFPDFSLEVLELRDLGDVIVTKLRFRGHAATSETPLDEIVWQVTRLRAGKVVWWRVRSTEAEALETART